MILFGTVTENDPATYRVRVEFPADGIVSGWLPVLVRATVQDTDTDTIPAVGTAVACLMDHNVEDGVVLGSYYDANNPPPSGTSETKRATVYRDGTEISYDSDAHLLTVSGGSSLAIEVTAGTAVTLTSGTAVVEVAPDGIEVSKAGYSLKTFLDTLLTQVMAITHPTAVGPTGPPLNIAAFTALKSQIPLFLK